MEIKRFREMTEEEKEQYVRETIEALAKAIRPIAKTVVEAKRAWEEGDKITAMAELARLKKLGERLWNALEPRKDRIIAALLYTIKPEYREQVIEMIEMFTERAVPEEE